MVASSATNFIAGWLARWIMGPSGPVSRTRKSRYADIEKLVEDGEFEQAMDALKKISVREPQNLDVYVWLLEISVRHLHNMERAKVHYRRGAAALKSEFDKEDLDTYLRYLVKYQVRKTKKQRNR